MVTKNKESEEIKNFLKNFFLDKRTHWVIILILFGFVLFSSVSIRMSNLPLLKDTTTGEYISTDLDSLYFYRQAKTKLELGYLPEVDELRSPGYNIEWIPELIDDYLIWNYKILKFFKSDITFDYASAISGPIFFGIGLILFFILSFLLTRSKVTALISSAFLAYAPGFLFRSNAGFYDHDHVGVFAIFALSIVTYFALNKYEKNWKNSIIFGVITGFFTSLVLVSWGGAITFVLVFLPFAFLLHYFFNSKDKLKFLVFYLLWIIFSVLFTPLLGGKTQYMYSRFLDSQGLLVLFVFGFALIDSLLFRYQDIFIKKIKYFKKEFLHLYSFCLAFVFGLIGLILIGKNPIRLFRKAWALLIYPFFGEFTGRLGTTVAENAQPYLVDLIGHNTKIIFWLFILGLVLLSLNFIKNSKNLKNKIILSSSMLFILFSILFSRISQSSLLNGENFISQTLYFIGALTFFICLAYVFLKERFNIDIEEILLFSIALTTAINARAAIRSFFLITPFICLIASYGVIEFVKKVRETKEESFKIVSWIVSILLIVIVLISLFGIPFTNYYGKYQIVSAQSKYLGPSANIQWQNAMAWVRNNTNPRDVFIHWWDYGYFIQTLANRPTVTDGGHSGGDHTDHYNGRYLLTTPNPKTALIYMKTWNVSYLLIDPTEMGKYGAFSKIGSNDSWDRISTGIFGGEVDDRQTQETKNGVMKIYQLGNCVDEDISYTNENNKRIFIPGISVTKTQQLVCNAYIAGVIVEFINEENKTSIKQPIGIFYYNNKYERIPLKNVFIEGKIVSFEKGINATIYFIPRVNMNKGVIEENGAIIYLSPRTFNSLMGRLYILNDPFNEYPTIKKAHFEDDPAVSYFKQFKPDLNEFIWYQGLRAPLKIWKVEYPEDTPVYKELLDVEYFIKKGFGGADELFE